MDQRASSPKGKIPWFILGLIGVIVFPAAASLLYFQISKDPSIRPLGVTIEAERIFGENIGEGVNIFADVYWVEPLSESYTKREFEDSIKGAFASKGVEVFVRFHSGGDETLVIYNVGQSHMGPYTVPFAAEGINAAVAALRMNRRDVDQD